MMFSVSRLHQKHRELGMGTEKGVELSESVRRLKECVVEYTSCLQGRTF
ncbi:MAG: hypothetical protein ACLUD2_11985 [Clostridium sp.]